MLLNISARVAGNSPVTFVASKQPNFSTIDSESAVLTPVFASSWVAKGKINLPELNTTYYIACRVGGVIRPTNNKVKTPKAALGSSETFQFGAGSCNDTGSTANTFLRLGDRADSGEMDFFIHLGDIHYSDIAINDPIRFNREYNRALGINGTTGSFFRKCPLIYMWDDHDYGPDNSSSDSPSREASVATYRSRSPYNLASSNPSDGVYYAFTRGRVRFIVTDVRSERSPLTQSDDANKVVFSAAQKTWFFTELQDAKDNNLFVCWVNTKPWCAAAESSADHWGGYSTTRTEIGNYINSLNINNQMFILSGDMHALAYDDGSSINNTSGLKIIQAAPLDRFNSSKGGPYTTGPIAHRQTQYGLIDITDTGGSSISIRFRGYSCSVSTQNEDLVLDESFTLTL